MKICLAQVKSEKGKVQENIQNHLKFIERAILLNADLIIFPELSITNYEPRLAKALSTDVENSIFNPFQHLSDHNHITIGIGMPTKATDGIHISMLIFQPNKQRTVYSKNLLHSDELPYFISSNNQPTLTIKGQKIALGICYETLQRAHFIKAKENNADLYVASVAKPKRGTNQAYLHFSAIAKEFKTPILMCNSIGYSDNFMSNGLSAVWNSNGERINQIDAINQGLLIYDSDTEYTEVFQPQIAKGQRADLDPLFTIYLNCKTALEKNGIYQWVDSYPTKKIIAEDIDKGVLFILKTNREIIGAINISEEQETEYKTVNWEFNALKVLVIHRLVIAPKHQRNGYARRLMDFAEKFARENNYTSIRLDAYSQNKKVVEFYKKRAYVIRGQVNFPKRAHPFHCMEKKIIAIDNTI
ncbi:GNAT family N-acetyltransferase [Winogradskyella eckloniae]|uniref:GNAT family N-acetyltransferase n=1 Tax=Winogradskyella eckloniae TaxID=1089306 RepID=UPI001565C644|nr:GNAT family N-acetyltransferase [Winogradskyella eckloniae]NRD19474.1 GNAT family N-acetyltransferase [Winogradskyella eckloniae]